MPKQEPFKKCYTKIQKYFIAKVKYYKDANMGTFQRPPTIKHYTTSYYKIISQGIKRPI